MKFRKQPVEVEAMQWPGYEGTEFDNWLTEDDHRKVQIADDEDAEGWPDDPAPLLINTLEGQMRADVGDWVIRGVKGELYPCKPDVFAATYTEVTA